MKNTLLSLVSVLIVSFANVSFATDLAAGKDKTASCAGCHGTEGISETGLFPNLAGQHAEYLESALKQYRDGDRENEMMTPMAKGLSNEDIANIAAYYASLKGK